MFSFPPLEPGSCDKSLVRRTLLIFFSKFREWSKPKIILTEKEIIFCQISSLNWYNRGRNLKPGPRWLFLSGVAPRLAQIHTLHTIQNQAEVMLLQCLCRKFTVCKSKITDHAIVLLFETTAGWGGWSGFRGDKSPNYASKSLAFYVVRMYHLFIYKVLSNKTWLLFWVMKISK